MDTNVLILLSGTVLLALAVAFKNPSLLADAAQNSVKLLGGVWPELLLGFLLAGLLDVLIPERQLVQWLGGQNVLYGILAGWAIGLMLPHVIRYNGEAFPDWYRELSDSLAGINGFPCFDRGAHGLAALVAELVRKADLPQRLSDCSVARESLPKMAEAAAKQKGDK